LGNLVARIMKLAEDHLEKGTKPEVAAFPKNYTDAFENFDGKGAIPPTSSISAVATVVDASDFSATVCCAIYPTPKRVSVFAPLAPPPLPKVKKLNHQYLNQYGK
jgi:hypothetical protein